jgi:alpha-mannosidase
MKLGNRNKNHNMEFIMSTPTKYVDALKKENVKWPVKYDDLTNYFQKFETGTHREYWSGYYSSRPDFKKHIKDASNQYYS